MQAFYLFFVALLSSGLSTTPEGIAWLAENQEAPGVVTLPSGLQYKIIQNGPTGGLSPRVDSPCECHYRGTFIITLFSPSLLTVVFVVLVLQVISSMEQNLIPPTKEINQQPLHQIK
jgi:hypothetical protein